MYYLKNSIQNIKRNKSKYIIVALLITIISLVSVVSIVINSSANNKINEQAQIYGSEVKISQNPEYIRGQIQSGGFDISEIEDLSYEDYEEFAKSEYVDYVEYLQVSQIYSETVSSIDVNQNPKMGNMGPQFEVSEELEDMSSFNITGADEIESSDDFNAGSNILIDGDFPKNENEILISNSLLEENSLSIGDELSFIASDGETEVKLKVVGTFENINSTNDFMSNSSNTIYTTFDTMNNLDEDKTKLEVTYHLKTYKDADKFEKEVEEIGIPDSMYVDKNEATLNQIVGPLINMKTLLTTFMIVVIILGGASLIFVNLLILKERKYEIGVLRALGQSKKQIVLSIVFEITIVSIISMLIGTLIGLLSSQAVSDLLLNTISSTASSDMQGQKMGRQLMNNIPSINTLSTYIDFSSLYKVILINIFLIISSSLTAITYILKYQPSRILREGK